MNAPFHPAGGGAASPVAKPAPASPELKRYLRWAQARAGSLLRAAGVDITAYAVAVRATVSFEGTLTGVEIVRSSGSPDVDDALEAVLRKVLGSAPPAGLIGGAITLRLTPSPRVPAKAPSGQASPPDAPGPDGRGAAPCGAAPWH